MPPDRGGRASKACATCRKQKTRCYPGTTSRAYCLRCQTLNLVCSLAGRGESSEDLGETHSSNQANQIDNGDVDTRLRRLEQTVHRLGSRLDEHFPSENQRASRSPNPAPSQASSSRTRNEAPPAPMLIIRDLAMDTSPVNETTMTSAPDMVNDGVLSYQDTVSLIVIFQEHYGRWVGFDDNITAESRLSLIRKSDLLLCACCLIAIRHTTQDLAARLAPILFDRAKTKLSIALLTTPQSLEFFQAALILCMWSTTVGQTPLSIDSWLLSGFALQHCLTSSIFDVVLGKQTHITGTHQLHVRWSVWNHLCLVHLHYCVGTRRRAMIGPVRIERCRKILEFDSATNFQSRMVAEINLYWCIYESSVATNVDLQTVQTILDTWMQEWKILMEQPRSQFLEMGFNFARLLLYERALQSKTTRVKTPILVEMANLSLSIIKLAINTMDERTRHLSDHIYHMITFAAVTLCRLLNLYDNQIATSHNVAELDGLILDLISWLYAVGLPCHVGHTPVSRKWLRELTPLLMFPC
ncbi:hypothetical protein BT63DRAFT_286957 [Microthyrium microscopicum]|uniref:Transcriptional activator of proteases prtT n=1 Tax=Microthyrium microscopicum TaxID=703497 RepID=A0A6A6UBL6_9PEZI|nr:hypothetical protein BT63DRAFT_286957 [Microthyrium microscopicum]